MTILTAVAVLGGLSLLLTTLLVLASRRLYVYEDPRIAVVEHMLPGSNCGACGYPGCRAFAEALVLQASQPASCTISTAAGKADIAELLGISVGAGEKRVARLACAGGSNVARIRAQYVGHQTCLSASQVAGGGKDCAWGCLGLGDCERSCNFQAIAMDVFDLPRVNAELCTACGDCIEACPKELFSLQRESDRLWVRCRNLEFGEVAENACEVACTACGKCVLDAPADVIRIQQNLARVDYDEILQQPEGMLRRSIERCPTGAIVWMDRGEVAVKGMKSKKVLVTGRKRPAEL